MAKKTAKPGSKAATAKKAPAKRGEPAKKKATAAAASPAKAARAEKRIDRNTLAAAMGTSPGVITQWAREKGCPHTTTPQGRLRFLLSEVEAWNTSRPKRGTAKDPLTGTPLEQARLRKETALAERYELQVQREKGELVSRDEHVRVITQLAKVARGRLLAMPSSLAPRLVGLTTPMVQDELDKEVRLICEALSDKRRYKISG